jgi:sterol 24-C-methyltransferase
MPVSYHARFHGTKLISVYAIEATCHAPSLEGIYREVYKCLKPGGVFGFYEWVMTDKWDASNPEHKDVAHGIEVSTLIVRK